MKIQRTSEMKHSPNMNLLLYGEPKCGKSTFCSKAPAPLVADVESGYKFVGETGADIPVAIIEKWEDMTEFYKEAKKPEYKTIIIDPVNEILEKLMQSAKANKLYVQSTDRDALSMRGWGYVKDKMRSALKAFRDLDKNVIFVAHTKTEERNGVNKIIPKLDANLVSQFMAMMDVIGYMAMMNDGQGVRRYITFAPSMQYEAGSRPKGLPDFFPVDDGINKLLEYIQKDKVFVATKKLDVKLEKQVEEFEKGMDKDVPQGISKEEASKVIINKKEVKQ